jgi:hypothetical protein
VLPLFAAPVAYVLSVILTKERSLHFQLRQDKIFFHDFATLLDESFHAGTFLALGTLVKRSENLRQSLHVAARLFKVLLKPLFEFIG